MTLQDNAFDFIESSSCHSDVNELLSDLRARIEPLGLTHIIMTNLPSGEKDVRPLVMLQGWPQDWFERYVTKEYFRHDVVARHATETHLPFRWSCLQDRIDQSPIMRKIAGEGAEFGLAHGILMPMHSAKHWQAVVSLGGADPIDISPREEGAIHLMAYAANRAARAIIGEPQIMPRLSSREREVVTWTAAGKTLWETSTILSISLSTAKKHLESARAKLGVVTAAQIVAEAIRLHEISI